MLITSITGSCTRATDQATTALHASSIDVTMVPGQPPPGREEAIDRVAGRIEWEPEHFANIHVHPRPVRGRLALGDAAPPRSWAPSNAASTKRANRLTIQIAAVTAITSTSTTFVDPS